MIKLKKGINLLKTLLKSTRKHMPIYFLVTLFIFTIYIKHTIALQYFILLFFIITLVIIAKRDGCKECASFFLKIKTSMIFLSLLTFWIIVQPIIASRGYDKTEIPNQFLVPLLYFFVGLFIVILLSKKQQRTIINIIFFVGLLHILIILISAGYHFIESGSIPIRKVYILPKDEASYFTNLVYSMFLAEVYTRFKYSQKYLCLSNLILSIIFPIFVIAVYLEGMRWGVVTFSLTTISFVLFYLFTSEHSKFKRIVVFLLTIFFVIALVLGSLKSDKRWGTIIETANIALNSNSLYWVNPSKFPCPKLSNGECVSMSNYLRLSQQIHGYKIFLEHPLGIGYSRYAYKNMINDKYNNQAGVYDFPHSGILNLLIGVGVPGFTLYLAFIFSLIYLLIKLPSSFPKIFTIFFIAAYNARGNIDMTFMNHSIKLFFFLLGIGIATAVFYNQEEVEESRDSDI